MFGSRGALWATSNPEDPQETVVDFQPVSSWTLPHRRPAIKYWIFRATQKMRRNIPCSLQSKIQEKHGVKGLFPREVAM
jgi:hypothetical protein